MANYSELTRAYVHARCEQPTLVGDNAFVNLSNPLCTTKITYCSSCKRMFPLADYRWADTGESLPDYHARHSAKATKVERFLASNTALLLTLILNFIVGAALGLLFFPPAKNGVFGMLIMVIGLGGVATIVLTSIFLFGFMPLINLRVCGHRDTRRLR